MHALDDPLASSPRLPKPLDLWTSHEVGLVHVVLAHPLPDGGQLVVVDGAKCASKVRYLPPDGSEFVEVPGGDALCKGGGTVRAAWPSPTTTDAVVVWATSSAWNGLWMVRRYGAAQLVVLPRGAREVAIAPSPSTGAFRFAALILRDGDDDDDGGDDAEDEDGEQSSSRPRITAYYNRVPALTLATYCSAKGWRDVCRCECSHAAGAVEGLELPRPCAVRSGRDGSGPGGAAEGTRVTASADATCTPKLRLFEPSTTPSPLTAVDNLAISADGRRAAWRVFVNELGVEEEAETADVWGAELVYGTDPTQELMPSSGTCASGSTGTGNTPVQLTRGAGRIADGCVLLSHDGSMLIYGANRDVEHPITSAHRLWATNWPHASSCGVGGDNESGTPYSLPLPPTLLTLPLFQAPTQEPLLHTGVDRIDEAAPAPVDITKHGSEPLAGGAPPSVHIEGLKLLHCAPTAPREGQKLAAVATTPTDEFVVLSWTARTQYRSALLRLRLRRCASGVPRAGFVQHLEPAAVTGVTSALSLASLLEQTATVFSAATDMGSVAVHMREKSDLELSYGTEGPRSYAAVFDGRRYTRELRLRPSWTGAPVDKQSESADLTAESDSPTDSIEPACLAAQAAAALRAASVHIPQPWPGFLDFDCELVEWHAPGAGGVRLQGILARATTVSRTASLIVHAHGGPAISVPRLRSMVAGRRYHYAPLLAAGYQVFVPLFRGTLGFGDDFSRANVNAQGRADLDDIISGIDALIASKTVRCGHRVGIYGGSYGGYMSMRAVAMTRRFRAAVAQYGFVHNRWMSYETADFTYEDEYIGGREVWPLAAHETAQGGDVFDSLHCIDVPTLFLHGLEDNICPPSQSRVAFNMLRSRGIPTGLVEYPGEGHGFDCPENQRDRDRRLLLWFLHHLPVAPPSGGEVEMSLLGKQAPPQPEVEMVTLKPHMKSPRSRDSTHNHWQIEQEPIELKTLGDGDEELQTIEHARAKSDDNC